MREIIIGENVDFLSEFSKLFEMLRKGEDDGLLLG
jgi:hypothetical protein